MSTEGLLVHPCQMRARLYFAGWASVWKLDEEVARLHLEKIGVPVEGSYKREHYRY